jgi:hypothetical protein
LFSLVFKPAAKTSASLRVLTGAREKREWEKMQLMLMQQHFAQLLHLTKANSNYTLLHYILHLGQVFRTIVDEAVTYSWLLKYMFHYGNVLIVNGF